MRTGAEINVAYGHKAECLFGTQNSGFCNCGKGFQCESWDKTRRRCTLRLRHRREEGTEHIYEEVT
jgi:hypothetical protein